MRRLLLLGLFLLSSGLWTQTAWASDVYYLGHWKLNPDTTQFGEPFWQAPQSRFQTGVIDLRGQNDRVLLALPATGWALFSYSQQVTDADLIFLTDTLTAPLSVTARQALQNAWNLPINGATLSEVLWNLLTQQGDPTGLVRWKPLMPRQDLQMRLVLGTRGVIREQRLIPGVSPEWMMVLAVLQQDYRRLSVDDPETMTRLLTVWAERYGLPSETFIPDDAPIRLQAQPHHTTITEDWNCTDSTTIDCDLDWTEISGDLEIRTERVGVVGESVGSFARARAESDLSSDDHYIQAQIYDSADADDEIRVLGRHAAAASAFYGYLRDGSGGGAGAQERQVFVQNPTFTLLVEENASSPTAGDLQRFEVNGSNLDAYDAGVLQLSTTDTSLTGNVRTGVACRENAEADNYEAGDLGQQQYYLMSRLSLLEEVLLGL